MIVDAARLVNSPLLPDEIKIDGDKRFGVLFKVVSKDNQKELEELRAEVNLSAKSIAKAETAQYFSELTTTYLMALHKKMQLLERVQALGIPATESLLSLCTKNEHEECLKNLLNLLPKGEQAEFVTVLEKFCISFEEPMKAVDAIILCIIPYPKESRCALIRAFRLLFGAKFLVKAVNISLIIPHVYMLLDSQALLQTIAAQTKTFEEIQSRLTK